jgi:glycosyltransferase involved in cell wall biosynthesis
MYLLEAMAAGVPVVQPRRGAYPEVIARTGGGLIVEPTVEALADGLLRLYSDRALGRELGTRGAAGVRRHYSVQASAARLLEVYAGLASRAATAQPSAAAR